MMKVLLPERSHVPSGCARATAFIDPKASEPELGSVIAQAPILSRVSRSRPQRSICSELPFDMMAAAGSPVETPRAVTMPGQ